MSWHPSTRVHRALDPAVPSRYRSAIVQCTAGRTMLVTTEDGDERLFRPRHPRRLARRLTRVLLANDNDWVVAIDPVILPRRW
jgi:hypothetical protein